MFYFFNQPRSIVTLTYFLCDSYIFLHTLKIVKLGLNSILIFQFLKDLNETLRLYYDNFFPAESIRIRGSLNRHGPQ